MTQATAPPLRAGDAGTITVWMLGILLLLLPVGGLSVDLWRAFDARRDLAGIVDAAAMAGASGVDPDHYYATGEARLDPQLAYDLAAANLNSHLPTLTDAQITVAPTRTQISVTARRELPFTLLRPFIDGDQAWVSATATSTPGRITP